jgi:hypothetical protein
MTYLGWVLLTLAFSDIPDLVVMSTSSASSLRASPSLPPRKRPSCLPLLEGFCAVLLAANATQQTDYQSVKQCLRSRADIPCILCATILVGSDHSSCSPADSSALQSASINLNVIAVSGLVKAFREG